MPETKRVSVGLEAGMRIAIRRMADRGQCKNIQDAVVSGLALLIRCDPADYPIIDTDQHYSKRSSIRLPAAMFYRLRRMEEAKLIENRQHAVDMGLRLLLAKEKRCQTPYSQHHWLEPYI